MTERHDIIPIDSMDILPYGRAIFYYETDQMGIVHHSNYIRWMEEARLDFLNQIGLPYDKMEEEGILVPVLSVNTQYKLAFHYGDTFSINCKLEKLSGIKFTVSYEIYNAETRLLHADGITEHCFVTKKMVPVRMPREYPEIYQRLLTFKEH